MKRMTPEKYKGEARRRVQRMTEDLVARLGAWNAKKIMDEMERDLRNRRRAHGQEDQKTVAPEQTR